MHGNAVKCQFYCGVCLGKLDSAAGRLVPGILGAPVPGGSSLTQSAPARHGDGGGAGFRVVAVPIRGLRHRAGRPASIVEHVTLRTVILFKIVPKVAP
jgi:hypothetical protein